MPSTENATRRQLLCALAGTVSVSLAGCIGRSSNSSPTLKTEWVSETVRSYGLNHHELAVTTIDGQTVVGVPLNEEIDAGDCGVFTLEGDGNRQWSDRPESLECSPHSIGDMAAVDVDDDGDQEFLVAMKSGETRAYDAETGAVVFRADLVETVPYGAPAVTPNRDGEDRLFVTVSNDGHVVVAAADGSVRWTADVNGPVYPTPVVEDVDGDDETEILVTSGGSDKAVTAFSHSGEVVWHTELDDGGRAWETIQGSGTVGIVVSTWGGDVLLLDGETGDIAWSRSVATHGEVGTTDGERIYATARRGVVTALDVGTGETVWRHESFDSDGPSLSPTVGAFTESGASEVFFLGHDGTAGILDAATGDPVLEQELDGDTYTAPVAVDMDDDGQDNALVMYGDGRVASLSVE